MGRAPRRPPVPPRPGRGARPVFYSSRVPNETTRALPYTARWHRVRDWAERSMWSFPGFEAAELSRGRLSERVEKLSASCVKDLRDAEEAFERGLPLEQLENFPRGPRREPGGFRRVIITALTWIPDEEDEIGYDPEWITLGWGMTAYEATSAAHRFVRDYEKALAKKMESRRLMVTALEVKFWTASETASYV